MVSGGGPRARFAIFRSRHLRCASGGRSTSSLDSMQDVTAAFDVSGFVVRPEVLAEAQCTDVDAYAEALASIPMAPTGANVGEWPAALLRLTAREFMAR